MVGFTLVELLVVIAIISVLAVLIFSVNASSRHKANVTRSVSNLRSIGVATQVFAGDNQGRLPMYGNPPTQTMGTVANRGSRVPRALFAADSPLGGHPWSKQSYLTDSSVFHNPRLRSFTAPVDPMREYGRAPNGVENIGYYYYSYPSHVDSSGRNPISHMGELLSNDRVTTGWSRMPIYSDVPDANLSTQYGYMGDEMIVVHLDGGVSVRSHAKVLQQTTVVWKIYYMATGVGQGDPR